MAEEDDKIQLISDYHQTFDTPAGKNVLSHMKKLAHYNMAYFPHTKILVDGQVEAGVTDIYEVCREEGKRAVIVHIERWLNKDPNEKKGITNE